MLSYQHLYHAGNLADVQKHATLAWVLDYLTRKDKPLTYIETHAGRGVYDLGADEAVKTGEAAAGIARIEALGIDTGERPSNARVKTLMISDPDGNHIAFAEPLEPGVAQ